MPNQSYYEKLFLIGAVWNWVASVTFALGAHVLFPLLGMPLPVYPVFFFLFLGLCFIFGIGYFRVYQNIYQNHDIIRLGIIGKLYVFAMALFAVLAGQVHIVFLGAGIVDLIFALLYGKFLLSCKKAVLTLEV